MVTKRSWQIFGYGTLVFTLGASGCHYAPDIAVQTGQASASHAEVVEPSQPAQPTSEVVQAEPAITKVAGQTPWLAASMKLPYRYSEIAFLNGARIGYTHNEITASESEGGNVLHVSSTSLIEVTRSGQVMRHEVKIKSIERADGALRRISEVVRSGAEHTDTSGTVYQEKLHLTSKNLAVKDSPAMPVEDIEWPNAAWGPLGVQQILLSQPMRPGQIFVAQVFVPLQHQLANVRFVAGQLEETPMPGNSVLARLLPIDVVMTTASGSIASRCWTNEAGEILKNVSLKGLNLASYRASREVAEKFESEVRVDIVAATAVKLNQALPDPLSIDKLVYEIEGKHLDPSQLLSKRSNQAVRSITPLIAEVTVYRLGPATKLPSTVEIDPPSEACRRPGPMIQSEDASVRTLAVELAGQAKQPAVIAMRLTRGVFERIEKKNFSRGFLSAAEVAKTLEGDCTEHAVLLAALLRNRGIPARLASGLVYAPIDGQPRMAYHLWVEAWLDQRWIPLDATLGGTIGAGHIKFLETPLEGSNPYVALLPVMEGMSQLSIKVLEMR